jgi:hypothetical protein
MSEYVSRFIIIISDPVLDRSLGLFNVQMKVVMNHESFNDFVNIANDSLSELMNRIHSNQAVEGSYTTAEQVYALDEAYQRIRNFFGEDADVTQDANMEWYGMETTIEHISNFIQPIIEFQIHSFPTFEFVQLAEGRLNEIQNAFIRTNVMA